MSSLPCQGKNPAATLVNVPQQRSPKFASTAGPLCDMKEVPVASGRLWFGGCVERTTHSVIHLRTMMSRIRFWRISVACFPDPSARTWRQTALHHFRSSSRHLSPVPAPHSSTLWWKKVAITLSSALWWRKVAITLSSALWWRKVGITLSSALWWRKVGITLRAPEIVGCSSAPAERGSPCPRGGTRRRRKASAGAGRQGPGELCVQGQAVGGGGSSGRRERGGQAELRLEQNVLDLQLGVLLGAQVPHQPQLIGHVPAEHAVHVLPRRGGG
ncbi:hypothetical protein ANANG_G00075500, partial [Anguilla anguilla]